MLFIIILCNCSVPSQLWAASVSHWVKRIARCKYKKQAGVGSCFGDYSDFSYFFPGLFRMFCWVLGAVLGISAVSATFSQIFPAFGLGFGLVLEYNHKKKPNMLLRYGIHWLTKYIKLCIKLMLIWTAIPKTAFPLFI